MTESEKNIVPPQVTQPINPVGLHPPVVAAQPPVVTSTVSPVAAAVDIEKTADKMRNEIMRKVAHSQTGTNTLVNKYGFIDPITILMLVSIMIGLIRIIQECRKDKLSKLNKKEQANIIKEEILALGPNPPLLKKRRIKKILIANMSKMQYKIYGAETYNELVKTGLSVTDEQVLALLEYKNV